MTTEIDWVEAQEAYAANLPATQKAEIERLGRERDRLNVELFETKARLAERCEVAREQMDCRCAGGHAH